MKRTAFILIALFIANVTNAQQQLVVIPDYKLNLTYASQKMTNWCWAAAISNLFHYYGAVVSQERIVSEAFDVDPTNGLPNSGASVEMITQCLNKQWIDDNGQAFTVTAHQHTRVPRAEQLILELTKEHPLLVAYYNCPTAGHAVLITGCSYKKAEKGPLINAIFLRDPMPKFDFGSGASYEELNGEKIVSRTNQFVKSVEAVWIVRVEKI